MTRTTRGTNRLRRVLATIATAATALATIAFVALPADSASADTPGQPETVTADVLPTWQINGVVWSQAVVGNTVYVTGSFTKARPPGVPVGGTGEIDANNVFAFDITTGNPVPNFSHSFDGQGLVVRATPDGKTVYFGGDFTTVDGQARAHVASFDVATGAMLDWAPRADGQVRGFAFAGDTVYVGGNFRSSGGQPRSELAAWNSTTKSLTAWAPSAAGDGFVWDMLTSPDSSRVIISGSFTTLNDASAYGMASIDAATGATLPWAATDRIKSAGLNGAISSLTTDGTQVYGTGYAFGAGASFEGTFAADPYSGQITWLNDCLGDTYASFPQGGVLYSVSHKHDCSVVGGFGDTNPRSRWQKALAESTTPTGVITQKDAYGWDFTGLPYTEQLNWYPDLEFGTYTSSRQAAWSVTGNANYVVLGGEFPKVNNVAQQGLVRFGKANVSPHAVGPVYNAGLTPSPYSNESGVVRVPFNSAWDRDNATITYDVFRSPSVKIATVTRTDGRFWNLPNISITDSGQTPGAQVRYQVRAKDADGNVQWSAWSPYVTVSGIPTSAYRAAVRSSGADHYWRLDEATGTRLSDDVGDAPGTASGLTLGTGGALQNESTAAITSAGGSSPKMTTQDVSAAPAAVTVEAWVKTTNTRGGRIVGFGDSATGTSTSGNTDRVLYLDTSGRANFAINDGSYRTVLSRSAVNDGNWHHLVGTVDSQGMQLFVDGKRVDRDQARTSPKIYNGFWRIGADQTNGFANKPTNAGLAGSIDDVAVYPTALSPADIRSHYLSSGRSAAWSAAPTDAYGAAVSTDKPDVYWRLNETAAGTIADSAAGGSTGNLGGTVTRGQTSAIGTGTATTFNGSNALVVAQESWNAPTTYSAELWFKTTTTRGGTLIGFGNTSSGLSTQYDRHVIMQNDGKIQFGSGQPQTTLLTPTAYNDGQWHHVVATQGASGMKLWLDTQLVGSNSMAASENYRGYWRIGGDKTWGSTSSNYIAATLDEVAVYPTALSEQSIRDHFAASGRTVPGRAPVAAFTSAANKLKLDVDASTSTDADGGPLTYAWNFGDGVLATGATASHTYSTGGTYTVTLKVTDSTSLVNVVSRSVTVVPNQAPTAAVSATAAHLDVAFDGSASADADGTIASYAWDFGDGATGTGATASHTYATAGEFTVTLTVTDDNGTTASTTRAVTTTLAPNQDPTAAFTTSTDLLAISTDATTSTDPDGTIQSYAWTFGDGATGTGVTAAHTYAGAGTYAVTLTVTDNRGGTSTLTHDVTVAPNQAPTAAFTTAATNLALSVNAGGSADPDGAIASYAWDFGDGSTGTGATATRTYTAGGTYTVTLTVTDDRGATATSTKTVTVTAAPQVWAQDAFTRTGTNGWGTATTTGGAWTTFPNTSTALSKFAVNGTGGTVSLSAGNNYTASLAGSTASTNTEERFTLAFSQPSTGGGFYFSAIARQIDSANDYRAKVRVASNGVVTLWLTKTIGGTETILTTTTVSGLSVTAADQLSVRFQATGTNPTTLKAKIWRTSATEPAAWTATTTDATAALQAPGHVGVNSYLSSSATAVPVVYTYDDFWAGPAQ
ncbi:PKD domain-containing protein [Microbacterium sp. NPDC097977]|uniref:PKD domain-containing protein n=1 Tax=Microbacterium sp. NPDC097977 TaxID=3155686 RepID=UPI003332BA73